MGSDSLVKPLHKAYGAGLEPLFRTPVGRSFPLPPEERLLDFRCEFIHFLKTPPSDTVGTQPALVCRLPTPSASAEEVEFTLTLIF